MIDRERRRAAGRLLGVLRLLVHREGDVPAPEDEDRERQAGDDRAERPDGERVEPRQLDGARVERVARWRPARWRRREKIRARAPGRSTRTYCSFCVVCMSRYEMQVAPEHEQQADGDVDERVEGEVGDRAGAARDLRDQQEQEVDGDAGEIRQHEDRRGDQPPAGEPADPRAEGARRPRERGAGVGHPPVELAVAERDQQHRDEADEDDRRAPGSRPPTTVGPERRGERVGGRDARDADDDGADEADRAGAQALLRESAGAFAGRRCEWRVGAAGGAHRELSFLGGAGARARRSSARGAHEASSQRSSRGRAGAAGRGGSSRRRTSSPGSQLEVRDGVLDAVAAARRSTSASTPSGSARAPSASTSSACAAPAMRMTPVSTLAGRSTETSESSRSSAPVRRGERTCLVEQGVGARSRADRAGDARDARRRVDRARALGGEHDRDVRGVEQLGRDRAEAVPAAQAAVGGADDDVRGAELARRGDAGPRANESAKRTWCAWSRHPEPPRPPATATPPPARRGSGRSRIRRCDHAAVVAGQHDDDVERRIRMPRPAARRGRRHPLPLRWRCSRRRCVRSCAGLLDDVARRRGDPCGSRRRRAGSRRPPCRCTRSGSGRPACAGQRRTGRGRRGRSSRRTRRGSTPRSPQSLS